VPIFGNYFKIHQGFSLKTQINQSIYFHVLKNSTDYVFNFSYMGYISLENLCFMLYVCKVAYLCNIFHSSAIYLISET